MAGGWEGEGWHTFHAKGVVFGRLGLRLAGVTLALRAIKGDDSGDDSGDDKEMTRR